MFMLGDTFDRRKYTNHVTAHRARTVYFDKLKKYEVDCIVGNHDVAYKNINDVNAPDLLLKEYGNIRIHADPVEVVVDGCKIAILPWVCSGNYAESMEFLDKTDAKVLFGHLEIQGFEMYKGSVNDHGFEPSLFAKFPMVCSGHFHHKSSRNNIHYLGAPYEMTWADHDDARGFHIFDTKTKKLEFIENPYKMFHRMVYHDKVIPFDDIVNMDPTPYKDSYLRVIVKNRDNQQLFDSFVDKFEKAGIADLQILEDAVDIDSVASGEIIDADDTLTIINNMIEQIDTKVEKKALSSLMTNLYQTALNLE